jgi:hypothetical protein
MTTLREAALQALEALQTVFMPHHPAIIALEAALAQQEQEPVAWRIGESYWTHYEAIPAALLPPANTPQPLYTTPPRREWQGLTEDDIKAAYKHLVNSHPAGFAAVARAKVCDAEATIEGIAQRCAAAIRARGTE